MNKDELLEISKNFFGSVFQVENVSEKIRNLTYREVKKVFSAYNLSVRSSFHFDISSVFGRMQNQR